MPTISDRAICIRQWDFSETSQTVSLFGRDVGIFRGLAKGSRRPRSNFSGGIDLLTLGDVVAIMKPDRELATVTEWGLARVWWEIRRDILSNRVAYYMAECVSRMLDQHDPHPGVFDGFVTALDALENDVPREQVLACFQWALLVDTGYKPKLDHIQEDAGETLLFSAREGGVVDGEKTGDRWRVRRGTIEILSNLEVTGELSEHDPDSIWRAARLLAAYMRELLGNEANTMRLVFPDLAGGRL